MTSRFSVMDRRGPTGSRGTPERPGVCHFQFEQRLDFTPLWPAELGPPYDVGQVDKSVGFLGPVRTGRRCRARPFPSDRPDPQQPLGVPVRDLLLCRPGQVDGPEPVGPRFGTRHGIVDREHDSVLAHGGEREREQLVAEERAGRDPEVVVEVALDGLVQPLPRDAVEVLPDPPVPEGKPSPMADALFGPARTGSLVGGERGRTAPLG